MEQPKELVFIPGPGVGHLVSAVEIGRLIVSRHQNLSITYLLIDIHPNDKSLDTYTQSLPSSATSRLRFTKIQRAQTELNPELDSKPLAVLAVLLFDSHKPYVKEAVLEIIKSDASQVVGIIVDMFCVNMMDVADEFKIPSYVFFTSSAGFLALMLQVQVITDEFRQDITEFDMDKELLVPGFLKPVPAKVLPTVMLDKNGGVDIVVSTARRIRDCNGIMVNTFLELETNAIKSLSSDDKIPPVFPVGPVISLEQNLGDNGGILRWLDNQPASSVVFLCFGSLGSFNREQVKEIAVALERTGYRFLWSLRKRPKEGSVESPSDYENLEEVLPQGFLERTSGVGKVIGWAPQLAVLSHPAVGGFVSHCGWNSTLESLWFGVPMATWPMYAEQQINAFEMVVELGMAVDIKMDYRNEVNIDSKVIVTCEDIERGIRQLMNENEIRKKVKDVKEKCQKALMKGGSSHDFLGRMVDGIVHNSFSR
ncbi:UDP-glucose flavonoid 3-O-glucosyltransferase 6-like [Olea europaea subsp. europaea]|uniref:Glycosyltransferase n=1 Tax=Olea europaea subsp. europaea TaxID=158383 RepID=A0A8S0VIM5_OLEEU|nr:UDP-glucose flavonoid 3-O-glucosyltransferase 6-like [Olea europaea subsp. europaea]